MITMLEWQQRKAMTNLRLAYLTGRSITWRLVPWHGQVLHPYLLHKFSGN